MIQPYDDIPENSLDNSLDNSPVHPPVHPPDHPSSHHAYPFHWAGNYTHNEGDHEYMTVTSLMFVVTIAACTVLKVACYCMDRQSRARRVINRNQIIQRRQRKLQLNTKTLTTELEDNLLNECSICLEEFEIGNQITELPCHHPFHAHCLSLWIKENQNCPLCRVSV